MHVHYETTVVSTGAKIDSSWDRREPFDFVLGEGDVLEAWDLGVVTMRPGETSEFTVDPSLAYGEEGAGDEIPASATLRFTIELLSGKRAAAAPAAEAEKKAPSEGQRLERAAEAKERGNRLTTESEFAKAQEAYREALGVLRALKGTELKLLTARNKLKLSCLLNLAHCDTKMEEFASAIKHASEALEIDPASCKALFRRGVARLSFGLLREAREDFLEASRLDPQNADIRVRLEECKQRLAEPTQWQRSAFGGIFGKAPEQRAVSRNLANLPTVWMDVQIGSSQPQRLRLALYADTVPRTAENFRALCTGERGRGRCGQPLHFKDTLVHKVVPRSVIEAGDIENYDGSGGESIYGRTFPDEGFADAHHKRGLLSMASRGPGTNNSKFFITLRSLPQFDNKHVVFGEVVGESRILERIEALETKYPDRPVIQVAIVDCGQER